MAARATGFTKLLAPSKTSRNNAEQSARTTERQVNRKDCIDTIIERKVLPPMRRFRMAQLELSSLQSGVGARYAVEPAILALPDFALRQISKRTCRTHGQIGRASCRERV